VGELIDRYALPHLRANRFSRGLTELAKALAAVSAAEFGVELTGAPPVPATAPERPRIGPAKLIGGLLLLVLFIYMGIRHPWLLFALMAGGRGGVGGGFGGGGGHGGFGGGGFGGGGAGRGF
jgi:uncharacterized protein